MTTLTWSCSYCTFENPVKSKRCEICEILNVDNDDLPLPPPNIPPPTISKSKSPVQDRNPLASSSTEKEKEIKSSDVRLFSKSDLEFIKKFIETQYKKLNLYKIVKTNQYVLVCSLPSGEAIKKVKNIFEKECTILSSLRHPYIVQHLGLWESDELSYVMEYCAHGSLWKALNEEKAGNGLTFYEKFDVAEQVAQSLLYLHTQSPAFIHRDLKSSNILIHSRNPLRIKVSDFGFTTTQTQTSGVLTTSMQGTPQWMAPEQFSQVASKLTVQADIWSFGCVLIELFGNPYELPWQGMNQFGIAMQVSSGNLPPQMKNVAHKSILSLITECLALVPTQRPSIMSVLRKLDSIKFELDEEKAMKQERKKIIVSPPSEPFYQEQAASISVQRSISREKANLRTSKIASSERPEAIQPSVTYVDVEQKVFEKIRIELSKSCLVEDGRYLAVQQIQGVVVPHLKARYAKVCQALNPKNEKTLYHGTPDENIAGILKNGFLPPVEGEEWKSDESLMLGPGIYFAQHATKAAHHSRDSCKLLVCRVALGNRLIVQKKITEEVTEKKYNSIWGISKQSLEGLGEKEVKTTDFKHDEFAISNPDQAWPLYVITFRSVSKHRLLERMLALDAKLKDPTRERILVSSVNLFEILDSIFSGKDIVQNITYLGDVLRDDQVRATLRIALYKKDLWKRVCELLQQETNEELQWLALRLFANFAFNSRANQMQLIKKGCVEVCKQKMVSLNVGISAKAAKALCNMVQSTALDMLENDGVTLIQLIAELMDKNTDESSSIFYIGLLSNLLQNPKFGPFLVKDRPNFKVTLCKRVTNLLDGGYVSEKAEWMTSICALIQNSYQQAGIYQEFFTSGALELLAKYFVGTKELKEYDTEIHKNICLTLTYGDPPICNALASLGVVETIIAHVEELVEKKEVPGDTFEMLQFLRTLAVYGSHVPDLLVRCDGVTALGKLYKKNIPQSSKRHLAVIFSVKQFKPLIGSLGIVESELEELIKEDRLRRKGNPKIRVSFFA